MGHSIAAKAPVILALSEAGHTCTNEILQSLPPIPLQACQYVRFGMECMGCTVSDGTGIQK